MYSWSQIEQADKTYPYRHYFDQQTGDIIYIDDEGYEFFLDPQGYRYYRQLDGGWAYMPEVFPDPDPKVKKAVRFADEPELLSSRGNTKRKATNNAPILKSAKKSRAAAPKSLSQTIAEAQEFSYKTKYLRKKKRLELPKLTASDMKRILQDRTDDSVSAILLLIDEAIDRAQQKQNKLLEVVMYTTVVLSMTVKLLWIHLMETYVGFKITGQYIRNIKDFLYVHDLRKYGTDFEKHAAAVIILLSEKVIEYGGLPYNDLGLICAQLTKEFQTFNSTQQQEMADEFQMIIGHFYRAKR